MLHFTPFDSQPEESPVARILDTLVLHALADGAREIQLRFRGQAHGASVHYGSPDAYTSEQMKIPAFVYRPLRAQVEKSAKEGRSYQMDLKGENYQLARSYALQTTVRIDEDGETLILKLNQKSDVI